MSVFTEKEIEYLGSSGWGIDSNAFRPHSRSVDA
jgi:hypothetical protein